ncbi:MAG: hypothetical protein PUG99_01490 [Firmicutes bacterium]|nr:hypothetical protein [Peptoniphilus sp.]MDD7362805.1 hypothetical protein [Bacillota bacterium]
MKNGIIFAVFLLICFLLTLTPLITEKALFISDEIGNASFDGLMFDDPSRVDHLQVTRRLENKQPLLYRYDIQFRYEGDPSSVRILGTPVRQIYFKEGVDPSKSKATLKGEYDKLNTSVMKSLQLKDIMEKRNFSLAPASELRLPLDEETEDYAFSVVTDPVTVDIRSGKTLADIGVFITNGKIGKFSDALGIKDADIKPHTSAKTQSGTYVNTLELINGPLYSRMQTAKTVATILCVVSVVGGLFVILTDKKNKYSAVYAAMVVFLLALPTAKMQAPTKLATFLAIPLLAYVGFIMYKLMRRPGLQVKSIDFRQGSGMAILVFILSTYVFAILNGFYL